MSWFSRLTWKAHGRDDVKQLHRLRDQPYAQHQVLWRFFERPAGAEQPFLFREMAQDEGDSLRFFLVSEDRPSPHVEGWRVESKPYAPRLKDGDIYRFSIRLNPTRSEKAGDRRGKRQDYVMSRLHQLGIPKERRAAERQRIVHEELPNWLRERGRTRGFQVEACHVDEFDIWHLRKGEHEVTLSVADFSGCLRVTEAERLARVLQQGFGHGRSFGMGLMLLKPW